MMILNPRAIFVVAGLLLPLSASAQDQDDARAARERGALAPFAEILAAAQQAVSPRAELLDAALLPNRRRSLVEVFMRERDGRVVSVVVDGRAARVVRVSRGDREGKPSPPPAGRHERAGRGPDRTRSGQTGAGGSREGRGGGGERGGGGSGGGQGGGRR